jgi:hypothetical protein
LRALDKPRKKVLDSVTLFPRKKVLDSVTLFA